MPLDVRADHLLEVQTILHTHVPQRDVIAFGSRVTGQSRTTSDLDLCIMSESSLSFEIMAKLKQAFSDSSLPYTVDVVDWELASESFRKIIQQNNIELQAAS